jgi:Flp pilus assembly protein TadD
MTTTTGDPVNPQRATSRRARLVLGVLLLGVVAGLAGLGWYAWRRYHAPLLPDIPLDGADAAVAEAVQDAREQVRRSPYSAEAWGKLGTVLRASGYLAQAAVCFGQAGALDPRNPRWPYLQGEALLMRGDADAALPPLRRAAELPTPDDGDPLAPPLRLAEALLAAGQPDEAEAALRRAQEAEPDHPAVQLDLGILAYQRDDLKASRAQLERCQHSPFTQKRACAQLAVVCGRLGDPAAAQEFARRAAALPPDAHWTDPWVRECLRQAPGKPGRFRYIEGLEANGRYADAVQELRRLQQEGPDYRVLVGLGKDLAQTGDFTGAQQALRDALHLSSESVQAHYYLAKILWARAEKKWEAGDREGARALYQAAAEEAGRALKSKPDHAEAHMILGLCQERLGRRANALASLRTAVACGPELADPSLHLGELLAADGRTDEARAHLEHALRLARPDDRRPREALERLAAGKGKSR